MDPLPLQPKETQVKLKLLKPIRIAGHKHSAGDEIHTDRETAGRWIRDGQAVPVAAKKEVATKAPVETRSG